MVNKLILKKVLLDNIKTLSGIRSPQKPTVRRLSALGVNRRQEGRQFAHALPENPG